MLRQESPRNLRVGLSADRTRRRRRSTMPLPVLRQQASPLPETARRIGEPLFLDQPVPPVVALSASETTGPC